jgi:hypothetical protein
MLEAGQIAMQPMVKLMDKLLKKNNSNSIREEMSLTREQKQTRLKIGNTAITAGISYVLGKYITGNDTYGLTYAVVGSSLYYSNIEDIGYYYGTKTGDFDKRSITYWLKTSDQLIEEQTGLRKGIDYDYINDKGQFVKKATGFEGAIGSIADAFGIDRYL